MLEANRIRREAPRIVVDCEWCTPPRTYAHDQRPGRSRHVPRHPSDDGLLESRRIPGAGGLSQAGGRGYVSMGSRQLEPPSMR